MSRLLPLKTLRPLAVSLMLLTAAAWAADPAPVAVLQGELRTFSPNGRFAVVVNGDAVSVFEAASWKGLGELTLEGISGRPKAVLVDNMGCVAVVYGTKNGQNAMELMWVETLLTRLAREVGVAGRTVSFDDRGYLRINGISNYFKSRDVVIRRKNGSNTEFNIYETLAYSCTISQFLSLSKVNMNLTPESAQVVRKASTYLQGSFPHSVNSPASIGVDQSDLATFWFMTYTTNGSHPAYGDKDDERHSTHGYDRMLGSESYQLAEEDVNARLLAISAPGYQLIHGEPWKVRLKNSTIPAFDLVQLGAPGFVPIRVSRDGRLVAFFNGRETRIYASSVVTDPYANLAPDVLQDLLMEKMMTALRGERYEEALPYFDRLALLGRPLPESYYYYQADALEKSGRKVDARAKAEAYLAKYGKAGKYYAKIISLMARL